MYCLAFLYIIALVVLIMLMPVKVLLKEGLKGAGLALFAVLTDLTAMAIG
jgi:hypothetical protein